MRACLWVYIQVYPSLAPILLVIYPMVSSSYTLQQSPFGNMSYNWLCWLSFELRHSYNYSSTCLGRPPSWAATLSMPRPTHFNVKLPLISGHLQWTDTFAWSRGCPFMTGITVLSFKLIPWILEASSSYLLDVPLSFSWPSIRHRIPWWVWILPGRASLSALPALSCDNNDTRCFSPFTPWQLSSVLAISFCPSLSRHIEPMYLKVFLDGISSSPTLLLGKYDIKNK